MIAVPTRCWPSDSENVALIGSDPVHRTARAVGRDPDGSWEHSGWGGGGGANFRGHGGSADGPWMTLSGMSVGLVTVAVTVSFELPVRLIAGLNCVFSTTFAPGQSCCPPWLPWLLGPRPLPPGPGHALPSWPGSSTVVTVRVTGRGALPVAPPASGVIVIAQESGRFASAPNQPRPCQNAADKEARTRSRNVQELVKLAAPPSASRARRVAGRGKEVD